MLFVGACEIGEVVKTARGGCGRYGQALFNQTASLVATHLVQGLYDSGAGEELELP